MTQKRERQERQERKSFCFVLFVDFRKYRLCYCTSCERNEGQVVHAGVIIDDEEKGISWLAT